MKNHLFTENLKTSHGQYGHFWLDRLIKIGKKSVVLQKQVSLEIPTCSPKHPNVGFGPRSMFPTFRDVRYDQRRDPHPMGIVPDQKSNKIRIKNRSEF